MSSYVFARPVMRVVLSLGLISVASCGKPEAPPAPPPLEVSVVNPIRREVSNFLFFNGITRGIKQTEVRPRVAGYLQKITFRPDSQVKEGDPLFIIDQRQYRVAAQRAEAVLAGKKATMASSKSTLDRTRQLVTQQAASDQELVDKQAAYDLAAAEVGVAEAELNDAKLDLDYTEVRSPISGRISKNLVDEGTLMRVNEPVLATIVADDEIYVDFQVSEAEYLDYQRTHPKSRTEDARDMPPTYLALGMSNEPGFPHAGQVISGDNTVDPNTGTYTVRGWFPNPGKRITPGLYVRIRAEQGSGEALLVPDIAVQSDPRGQFVYVVNDKSAVERRAVQPGPIAGPFRRIISGLETTDKVIVNGLTMVRPEAPVSAKLTEPPPVPAIESTTAPSTQPATQTTAAQGSTTQPATKGEAH